MQRFEGSFDAVAFATSLLQPVIAEQEAEHTLFPVDDVEHDFPHQPFAAALRNALAETESLSAEVAIEVKNAERKRLSVKETYQQQLGQLGQQMAEATQALDRLEVPFSDAGRRSTRIGEQLASLERQRRRAEDARLLVTYFVEFCKGTPSGIFADSTKLLEAALIAKRLQTVAQDAVSPAMRRAKQRIDEFIASAESRLLDRMNAAYDDNDAAQLHTICETLNRIGVGARCTERYLAIHTFFAHDTSGSSTIPPPRKRRAELENLKPLCDDVRAACKAVLPELFEVFPDPLSVYLDFVSRAVEAHIAPFVSRTLDAHLNEHHLQPHLAALATCYAECDALLVDAGQMTPGATLAMQKNKLLDTVFSKYLGARYEQDEERCQAQLVAIALDPFKRFTAGRRRPAAGAAHANVVISTKAAVDMLQAHSDASDRAVALVAPASRGPLLVRLYKNALTVLVKEYLEACLHLVQEDLALTADGKLDGTLVPSLEAVQAAGAAIGIVQTHFSQTVAPSTSELADSYRECVSFKNILVQQLEDAANSVVEAHLGVVTGGIARALSRQKRAEYRPKEAGGDLRTPTCRVIIDMLERAREAAEPTLDETNLGQYLHALAFSFFSSFDAHWHKLVINAAGGLLLARELSEYAACLKKFKLPDVNERIARMRDVGNLFVVTPESIVNVLRDCLAAGVARDVLREMVGRRADYRSERLGQYLGEVQAPENEA